MEIQEDFSKGIISGNISKIVEISDLQVIYAAMILILFIQFIFHCKIFSFKKAVYNQRKKRKCDRFKRKVIKYKNYQRRKCNRLIKKVKK